MNQQAENSNAAPNQASGASSQNGAVLASSEQTGEEKSDVESKVSYKLLVGALTLVSPLLVILFFDMYNKQYLSYYNIFDVELSYSLDVVLRQLLLGGIVLILFVICSYFAVCATYELLRIPCLFLWHKLKGIAHTPNPLFIKKWLCSWASYIIISPIAFWYYSVSITAFQFKQHNFDFSENIIEMCVGWFLVCSSLLALFLYLLERPRKPLSFIGLLILIFLVLHFIHFQFEIKLIGFFGVNLCIVFIFIAFGVYPAVIFCLAHIMCLEVREKLARYFSLSEDQMKEIRFLTCVLFGMIGIIFLLISISPQQIVNKSHYSIVYQSQESNGIIGISVYEDDSKMIVIPAREVHDGASVRYEVIEEDEKAAEDSKKDEKRKNAQKNKLSNPNITYDYMYIDKTGLFIKRVPNEQIEWKNRLNKQ